VALFSDASDVIMMPPIFYVPLEQINKEATLLNRDESRHAVNILRLKRSAQVMVVDGLGTAYRGEISKIARDGEVSVKIYSEVRNFGEPLVRLTLAAGLSSSYKFDSVVQKGTELGVTRFVPILTAKSKVKIDDPKRARSRQKRLEKVALASIKQCRRAYRPIVSLPVKFEQFMSEVDKDELRLIFDTTDNARPFSELEIDSSVRRVCLLVGPESGFSREERERALESGFVLVGLGSRLLRTETAGPVACALLMNRLGELR